MMWPPSVLRLRVDNRQRHFGLWLPLFLIWPVLLVLGLVFWPIMLIIVIVFWRRWWRPLLLVGPVLLYLICALRGLEVDVAGPSETVKIYFR